MLDACAPGSRIEQKLHHFWVFMPNTGPVYRGLPLGKHGTRRNPEIEIGHVRRMARSLGILECAQEQIENL